MESLVARGLATVAAVVVGLVIALMAQCWMTLVALERWAELRGDLVEMQLQAKR